MTPPWTPIPPGAEYAPLAVVSPPVADAGAHLSGLVPAGKTAEMPSARDAVMP
jgi:hypothetical protein